MRKRKEDPPSSGSPAWMSTFSDLMNLLLCFFILLFASSTIDAEKLEQISASFSKNNVLTAGSTAIGEGHMVSSGVKQLHVLDSFVTSFGKSEEGKSSSFSETEQKNKNETDSATTAEQPKSGTTTQQTEDELKKKFEETGYKQSEQMNAEISKMLQDSKLDEKVSVGYNAQYVELSMNGGILFASGQAELTKDAKRLMSRVGDILVKYRKCTIEIEGHTDNVPAQGSQYKDNQYLSAARAISVYEYLLEHKNLIAKNMKHSGYGDSRPKASNKTDAGRAKNRRVEIKIYNKISSDDNN